MTNKTTVTCSGNLRVSQDQKLLDHPDQDLQEYIQGEVKYSTIIIKKHYGLSNHETKRITGKIVTSKESAL